MPVIRTPEERPDGCCAPVNGTLHLTTVRSRLLTPDGRPMAGREVVCVLRAAPTWLADGSGRVAETATTRTDSTGWWELQLVPNKYLEPSLDEQGQPAPVSYYEIKEGAVVSAARVPAAGEHDSCPDPAQTCTVFLRSILIDPPSPGPVPWRPISTIGTLHNVDHTADTPTPGHALVFDGQVWVPAAVSSTTELAKLTDIHPSLASAQPGDVLEAIEYDPSTGRLLWGVNRPAPELAMQFGAADPGDMTLIGEITSPETLTQDVEVYWHGTTEGPMTTIPAGNYSTSHTYTAPGTYTVYYQYTDGSEWGTQEVTAPWPEAATEDGGA